MTAMPVTTAATPARLARARAGAVQLLVAALTLLPFAANARDLGDIVRESRDLEAFEKIQLDGAGTLSVTVGERFSLAIETHEALLDLVKTDVSGKLLRISTGHGFPSTLKVDVTLPKLTGLALSGSTEARIAGPIEVPSFELVTAGSTEATIESLTVETFKASLAGASHIEASGKAEAMSLKTAGSARAELGQLETARTEVTLVGAATTHLYVTSELSGKITGKGVIHLAGSPARVDLSTLGTAQLIQHEDAAHVHTD